MTDKELYEDTIDLAFLGHVIRRLRERQGLSLRELASKVPTRNKGSATDPSTLSLIERGERNISYPLIQNLAKALKVEPDWLIMLALPVHPSVRRVARKSTSEVTKVVSQLGQNMQEILIKHLFETTVEEFVEDFKVQQLENLPKTVDCNNRHSP